MPSGSDASRILGDRMRDARQRAGITQMDLANLAGVNVSNYGRIERGEGNPNFETLIRLASVLGVDASVFVKGIGASALPAVDPPRTAAEFLKWKKH